MTSSTYLETLQRPGLPSFLWTQFLGALNDNVFKIAASMLAIQAVTEEFTGHQSELTMRVLAGDGAKVAGDGLLDEWVAGRQAAVNRADALMGELRGAGTIDLAMLAVANRQLRAMIGD